MHAHIISKSSMGEKMISEYGMKDEKFVLQLVRWLHSLVEKNILPPHSEKLPSLEFFEKWKLFYMIEWISFDKPITKRYEL